MVDLADLAAGLFQNSFFSVSVDLVLQAIPSGPGMWLRRCLAPVSACVVLGVSRGEQHSLAPVPLRGLYCSGSWLPGLDLFLAILLGLPIHGSVKGCPAPSSLFFHLYQQLVMGWKSPCLFLLRRFHFPLDSKFPCSVWVALCLTVEQRGLIDPKGRLFLFWLQTSRCLELKWPIVRILIGCVPRCCPRSQNRAWHIVSTQ